MKTIFTFLTIIVAVGVLWYVANTSVSTNAVPSFSEFIASTTVASQASSTIAESLTENDWNSTSTVNVDEDLVASELLPIKTPNGTLFVAVAKNPTTRERGLSGYPLLPPDQGMLFIFPTEGKPPFWMKDMNFPIDIVWMDKYKKIVGIADNVSPETFPKSFSPPTEIQFVLEVNAGTAEKLGLKVGTTIIF